MRIWSLHPKYLDAKGVVALRREAAWQKKLWFLFMRTSGLGNN
jgi:hypothetical protein